MDTTPAPTPTPRRKKLPIGLQSFRQIREDDHYYVDKTGLMLDLIESGKHYFMSRPRRFGKSLLLDTFKALFEGQRALFSGLAAETRWDWTRRYPVIRIDFGGGVLHDRAELDQRIDEILRDVQRELNLPEPTGYRSISGRLAELIRLARVQHGAPVVVLIDEYDKPILDNITDRETAAAMRDGLRNLYSVLKGADEHLKFVFITGVSKFSKVSLFSGLNNLFDITLEARWSALCGYTDDDLDTVFAPELPGLDREEIRRWYNGYNWGGTSVYNPFDALLLFKTREFKPYWFETGTPTFLIDMLTSRHWFTPDLSRTVATETLLSAFDVERIETEALLFQAGYLTIDSVWAIPGRKEYTLKYPNKEVQASLNDSLLRVLTGGSRISEPQVSRLYRVLQAQDVAALRELFHAFYASIPHDWYRSNDIAKYEGYYASVFYSHFAALGFDIRVEETTNHGRIDMAVEFGGAVWIFEFKVVELVPEGKALAQIKAKGYADQYRGRGEPIHLVGVEFSRDSRNIVGFETETWS
ncbi:ATP-binding protein [Sphaerotilus sp.]|uniref:ATP-binding protein n=1 Tax=Sphaerotilus sp. TaxID=2093942 RepID=UPI002ACDAEB0|nr:ATP-binding protein [Sphaerotilus sp.]MDZ7857378.1 ATP-binding protein [Sphaerotilus sp.]